MKLKADRRWVVSGTPLQVIISTYACMCVCLHAQSERAQLWRYITVPKQTAPIGFIFEVAALLRALPQLQHAMPQANSNDQEKGCPDDSSTPLQNINC